MLNIRCIWNAIYAGHDSGCWGENYGLKGGKWLADVGSFIIFTVCKTLSKEGLWTYGAYSMYGRGNAHRILVVSPVKKREFGTRRPKWENDINP